MSLDNTFSKQDTHYFTLDLHRGATLYEPLKFKQFDHESRVLGIELVVHDTLLDLTNSRVDMWVYKPDGKLVVKEVVKENIDIDNSILIIPLTRQMLTTLPKIECEIVVTGADNRVLSFPIFEIEIEDSNIDTASVVSSSEFDMFFASLVRMEQWIRDFDTKNTIIERMFAMKLLEIEQQKTRLVNEFEELSKDLVEKDEIRFEELRAMTIGEFTTWFTQAKAAFAYAGREIEKRFNELWEKCNELNEEMEKIVQNAEENRAMIEQVRIHVEEVSKNIDLKYEEIVKLYEDGLRRFQEMENIFAADQAQRATEFTNAQTQRANEFTISQTQRDTEFDNSQTQRTNQFNTAQTQRANDFTAAQNQRATDFTNAQNQRTNQFNSAQTQRATDFTNAQNQRDTEFDEAQTQRATAYNSAEAERDSLYAQAEAEREDAFQEMETARNEAEITRQANENERIASENERTASENERIENENERIENANTMYERFNAFLHYREVVE